jgi:hypothetical protein
MTPLTKLRPLPSKIVADAMAGILRDVGGYSRLSAEIARWLIRSMDYTHARKFLESVLANLEVERRGTH